MQNVDSGILFIVSAPSGAGKTTLVQTLVQDLPNITISVSHTTRRIRPGEVADLHYHFVSLEKFAEILNNRGFLEYALVFDNYYGTSKTWVEETLSRGMDVILEIDWQGANQIRAIYEKSVSIFILPPTKDVLLERLKNRSQDPCEVIEARMNKAEDEMLHYYEYNYVICNQDFKQASTELRSIVVSERLRLVNQRKKLQGLLQNLLNS